jgi:hypothetical protein
MAEKQPEALDQGWHDMMQGILDAIFASAELKKEEAKKGMKTNVESLPESIRKVLPEDGQREFMGIVQKKRPVYNENEQMVYAAAWAEMRKAGWYRGEDNQWTKETGAFKSRYTITKIVEEKHQVFGWALIAFDEKGAMVPQSFLDENGQVTDWQQDMVDEEDLEKMAYRFVLYYREGGEMHIKGGSATLIESVVFTEEKQKAMGLPDGALPVGWWIGFLVTDDDAWEGIKNGTYQAFSIEGTAIREEVEE